MVPVVVPGVGGGAGDVVGSGGVEVVVVGTGAVAVVFTSVSRFADQTAAESTTTTAHANMIRRASTASVCPVMRR